MPLGAAWTPFVSGDAFGRFDIIDRFREMENWMNGNIRQEDLKDDAPWVEHRHIYKPEFYGSPAPRVEAVSGDTHYRYRPFNIESRYYRHEAGGWYKKDLINIDPRLALLDPDMDNPDGLFVPVEGLSASIHLDEPSLVTVNANWYAWESGGTTGYDTQRKKNRSLDDRVAMFKLFRKNKDDNDGEPEAAHSTSRVLYGRSDTNYYFRRQSFSTTYMRKLSAGVHHLYVGCMYILADIDGDGSYTDLGDGEGHRHKHVYIDGRNFIVDAMRIYEG